MRVVLYTGKGGVGKTTTAAATAVRAAECGLRTLVLSADAAHSLGDVLLGEPDAGSGGPGEPYRALGPDVRNLAPRLDAAELDARRELKQHWGRIHAYLVALFRYQGIDEVLAEELALLPGAEELTTLLAVDEHARSGAYDFIVVDCAPTDSTLRLATLPEVARTAVRLALRLQRALAAIVTPLAAGVVPVPLPDAAVFADLERVLFRTLRRLRERLTAETTSVRMIVTPERMVIDEARRAFTELSLFELSCDLVIVNRTLPNAAVEEAFFRDWGRVQAERIEEVRAAFAPVRILTAPLHADEVIGLEALSAHGRALFGEGDPSLHLSAPARVRFQREAAGYRVCLPLPGASPRQLEVSVIDAELVVRAGAQRRAIKLPRRVAACRVSEATLQGDELVVTFEAAG